MKKIVLTLATALVVGWANAVPSVSGVVIEGGTGRRVRVAYELSEAAVVTARFKVNGQWLPGEKVTALSGDVCCKVAATAPGETRQFSWRFADEPWFGGLGKEQISAEVELTAWATDAPPDYMTIGLESPYAVRYYADAASVPGGVTDLRYKTTQILLRKIPAAGVEWCMGTSASDRSNADCGRGHSVVLTSDYYMAVYETTQKQMSLIGSFRSSGGPKTDEDPDTLPANGAVMTNVRGVGATPTEGSYVGRLIANCHVTSLDLPSEARWEFAARAGSGSYVCGGSINAEVNKRAWTSSNNDGKIHAVGTREPNAFGLYDMFGNLWELCLDVFAPYSFVEGETSVDPLVLTDGTTCVGRGGGYANTFDYAGSAVRVTRSPTSNGWDYGYRLCCDAVAY